MAYYDENPDALRAAIHRADVAAALFGGTNVLATVWAMDEPETPGGQRLKPELEALVDRVAGLLPEGGLP